MGSGPGEMEVRVEGEKVVMGGRAERVESRARTMFGFSVMVAMGPGEGEGASFQAKLRREEVKASQTCMWWYGEVRDSSMFSHAPIRERKETEEGLRELARLEYWFEGGCHEAAGVRSWASIRASLRVEAMGEDAITCQSYELLA